MIKCKNITKYFGSLCAVNNLSLDVPNSGVLGFLGPNGAGKSTTMRIITGYLKADSGNVLINNKNIHSNLLWTKSQIGYLPERSPVYKEMHVNSFLKFVAGMRECKNINYSVDKVVSICGLDKVKNKIVGSLSKGYTRRVCLAQALISDPPCLVLDEPTDGLDPIQKKGICKLIKDMGAEKSILVSTHILDEVESYCSDISIISEGNLLFKDTVENAKKRSSLFDAVNFSVKHDININMDYVLDKYREFIKHYEVSNIGDNIQYSIFSSEENQLSAIARILEEEKVAFSDLKYNSGSLEHLFNEVISKSQ